MQNKLKLNYSERQLNFFEGKGKGFFAQFFFELQQISTKYIRLLRFEKGEKLKEVDI